MSTRMLKFKLSKIGKQMETKKTNGMEEINLLDERYLTEPQGHYLGGWD